MTLEAIGQKLKSAREAQGLSLRQIYERTKIPINHLQSIDSGQPDDLPEPVYVAGFIKLYAECIGLDGQVLADEYKRSDIGHNGNGDGKPKTMSSQPSYITPEYLKHARIDNSPPRYKLLFFPILIGIVIIGVLHWYSSQSNNSQPDPSLQSLKESVSPIQQTPNGSTTANSPASGQQNAVSPTTGTSGAVTPATNVATTTANDDKVILSASRHVWVDVKRVSTGDPLYTGFLEQGDRRTFEDSQGIRVTAGNGGSLSVESKGKIEPFGEAGKKSERTFSTVGAEAAAAAKPQKTADSSSSSASSSTNNDTKPKKPTMQKTSSTSTTAHKWHSDDGGTRSIPGSDGTRSIDVPYRYSEGRLDAN